jgi:hypothetical protein
MIGSFDFQRSLESSLLDHFSREISRTEVLLSNCFHRKQKEKININKETESNKLIYFFLNQKKSGIILIK